CCTALGALPPCETPWPREGDPAPAPRHAAGGVHDPENAAVAQAIVNESADSPALNHPRVLQDRQLLRDVRLRAAEGDGEVADADGSVTQALHDGQALGGCERTEDPGPRGEGRSPSALPG